jgi:nitric oxide reductase large subunit
MRATNRLWTVLGIVFVLPFAALGWLGRELFRLFLLGRALWPPSSGHQRLGGSSPGCFLSATCIGAFYAASLSWG